jgi:hypothetical protein
MFIIDIDFKKFFKTNNALPPYSGVCKALLKYLITKHPITKIPQKQN